MGELKVGTIAMVYGLIVDVEDNGKCVTLLKLLPPNTSEYLCPITGQRYKFPPSSEYWWLCDNEQYYRSRNLLPIGDKDNDLVTNKEKDNEH